jgi:hypothetical protein
MTDENINRSNGGGGDNWIEEPSQPPETSSAAEIYSDVADRGAIHQLLSIILNLRILVLLPLSTLPYVVRVKNYS